MKPSTGDALGAAESARRQATVIAAVGAAVPTVLAAQGMAALATDLLGFHWLVAVALACFLELALVSSALLARASALAGRPGGADVVAVWVVSATSGLLAGMHELVATDGGGGSHWQTDPGSFLAAAVRAVAPLVAAWLWERVLHAARAEQAERTVAEIRRDKRLFALARAALTVRRLSDLADGRSASRRLRRAQRQLDRAHFAALKVTHPGTTMSSVMTAIGQVDHMPTATRAPSMLTCPDTADTAPAPRHFTAEVADDPQLLPTAAAATQSATTTPDSPMPDNQPESFEIALDLVRNDRTVSGSRVAEELVRQGRPVSVRTGQRLRGRALALLENEPATV